MLRDPLSEGACLRCKQKTHFEQIFEGNVLSPEMIKSIFINKEKWDERMKTVCESADRGGTTWCSVVAV